MKNKPTVIEKEMKRKINPTCEHINYENLRDCGEEAEYVCMCCSSPTCEEHKRKECPYGGMGYIEI